MIAAGRRDEDSRAVRFGILQNVVRRAVADKDGTVELVRQGRRAGVVSLYDGDLVAAFVKLAREVDSDFAPPAINM